MRPHTTSVVRTLRMHHLRLRLYVTRTFVLLSLFLFFFFIVVPGLFSKALIRFSHSRLGLRAASIYFLQPPLPPSPLPALTLLPLRIHFLPIDNFLSCLLFFLLPYFFFLHMYIYIPERSSSLFPLFFPIMRMLVCLCNGVRHCHRYHHHHHPTHPPIAPTTLNSRKTKSLVAPFSLFSLSLSFSFGFLFCCETKRISVI